MDRSVGPRYGSGLYILTRSHILPLYDILSSVQDDDDDVESASKVWHSV